MRMKNIGDKFKSWWIVYTLMLFSLITACSGTGSVANNSVNTISLSISNFVESNLLIGESTTATISISNLTSQESVIVAVNNNNPSIISIAPSNCTLSATANTCTVKVIAIGTGTATFTAASTGITSVTSGVITVSSITPVGILFGTLNGLVFDNSNLLSGNSFLSTVDGSQVLGLAVDSNNNIYAGTFGGVFNGFGAGKVFKYIPSNGNWQILAGSGSGGSLDGSSVNTLVVDSNNNLYAGTDQGNVFKYNNGVWSIMGTGLSDPIKAMALDSNNNIYVGTYNQGGVFKYVAGAWVSLGVPDGTAIQSIVISSAGSIYSSTNGNGGDGQVYLYDSNNTTWNAISAFSEGQINALAIDGNTLYSGTNSGNVYQYDSGTSWTQLGSSPDTSAIMTLSAYNSTVYAGTYGSNYDGQIYQYNGSGWTRDGVLNNGGVSAIILKNGKLYSSTANNGISSGMVYSYTNNIWSPIGTGALDGTPIYSTTVDSNGDFYAGTQGNIFKYKQNSKSWILLGSIYSLDSSGIATLVTYGNNIYAGTQAGNIFISNINSANWTLLATYPNHSISSLKTDESGALYASVNDSSVPDNGTVWKYNTNTGVWTILSGNSSASSLDGSTIQSLSFDKIGNLYAATAGNGSGGFVWKYPAGGNTWSIVGTGTLDASQINALTTDDNLNIYAGTANGNVFKYNGINWMQINIAPFDGSAINNLNFDQLGNLYATTAGGNVWEYLNINHTWVNTYYGIGVSIDISGASGF